MAKGNGLALERCTGWGDDPAHEEDCWRVIKYRETDAQGDHPEVVSHVPFRQAMALVMDVPLEEIKRQIAEWENETPEEEQAWWDALNKTDQSFAQGKCPNCGLDWTVHSAWIANPGDKTCVTYDPAIDE